MVASFTDQPGRVRRTIEVALANGAAFEASWSEEDGRHVVIEARRLDGQGIGLRFRGVRTSTMSAEPEAGAALRLRGVGAPGLSLLRLVLPGMRNVGGGYVRVRIEAGAAMLDIVCQDAEWWERAPGEAQLNYPVYDDHCSDCGDAIEPHSGDARCPACFDTYLSGIEPGFLESYRQFGCRSRLVLAETCLRGLVLESPPHRKVLAMTIFEQYVGAMSDLAALFTAFRNRENAPLMRSFLEYKLDTTSALRFFEDIRNASDAELCYMLGLPLPATAAFVAPHLDADDQRQLAIAVYHLMLDLRKATDQGDEAAMALAQFAGQAGGAIIANDAKWLDGAERLTPDQVALLVFDNRRRAIHVQGLSADEGVMGNVVDAIDTVTRAASNLIYAYLQANDL